MESLRSYSSPSVPASTNPTGAGMDQLIPVINKLQDVFNAIGGDQINLPQIVVVGSQSSGKSSVLENIVGRDFLPRGSGIVTRRPLVLQLINMPADESREPGLSEWGEFLHKPNEMFYDFAKIRQEIEAETDRTTGQKGISPQPIRLRIYSPHVLNLTLVDLPGMTRVPVGDQPVNIEEQIRNMIMSYITRPTTVILAVTAANTDISNSDAIQLARSVDPDGSRTIGVITKIDIMDKGTDALDVLLGKVIPLRLGYVGVINRSQGDINTKKTIREALKDEANYFGTHPLYRSIASRLGTPYLTRLLNKILMVHIRDCLPELKSKINKMISETQNELSSYGDQMWDTAQSKGALLLQIITRFSTEFRDAIDGRVDYNTTELYGGARINYIFAENYSQCLQHIHPLDGLSVSDVRTAIKNAAGPRGALFVPESAFEALIRHQIVRLEEPGLQCVELVHDEMQRIVSQVEFAELTRFQQLRERIIEEANILLHRCRLPARKMINQLVNVELAFINMSHPDFIGTTGALGGLFESMAKTQQEEAAARAQQQNTIAPPARVPRSFSDSADRLPQIALSIKPADPPNNKERQEVELIQNLMVSYFDIVRKNILDSVPKAIMYFLVNSSKDGMQNELVRVLYREELFDELLEESPMVASRRKSCTAMLEVLKRASEVLNEVRDFPVSQM